jgi:hypothetical protein
MRPDIAIVATRQTLSDPVIRALKRADKFRRPLRGPNEFNRFPAAESIQTRLRKSG